jgi:hypothetical protein
MMNRTRLAVLLFFVPLTLCLEVSADAFKSLDDCKAGRKVTDMLKKTGVVTGVSNNMCMVKLDDGGKTASYIFWMLHDTGGSAETDDKLVSAKYSCYAGDAKQMHYVGIDIRITMPATYESGGKSGKFRLDAESRKITFESGPLEKANGKLLRGPNIGLNMDGGSFYATVCSISK